MTLMSLVQFPCLAGLSHQESNPEIPETIPGIDCVQCFSWNTLAPPCGAPYSARESWDTTAQCCSGPTTLSLAKCPQAAAMRQADAFGLIVVG